MGCADNSDETSVDHATRENHAIKKIHRLTRFIPGGGMSECTNELPSWPQQRSSSLWALPAILITPPLRATVPPWQWEPVEPFPTQWVKWATRANVPMAKAGDHPPPTRIGTGCTTIPMSITPKTSGAKIITRAATACIIATQRK